MRIVHWGPCVPCTVEEAEIRCKSFKRVVEYNKMTQNFIYEYVFIGMFTQSPQ